MFEDAGCVFRGRKKLYYFSIRRWLESWNVLYSLVSKKDIDHISLPYLY